MLFLYSFMKKLLLLIFITVSSQVFAQDKDKQNVLSTLEKQTQAWNNGDLEKFMVGYWNNDSLMFIGKNGITYGYKPTLENYKKNYSSPEKMGKLKFTILHVNRLSTDIIHVVGKWYLTRSIGDVSGHFTVIFKKINGEWVIISDHSS